MRVLYLTLCSILLIPFLLFGAAGDGGRGDSTVVLRYDKGLSQDGDITNYNKSNGDILYSRCIYFDMALNAAATVYSRGYENLYDSTWYGGKYLDLHEFIGQYVHVLVYTGVVVTNTIDMYIEQAPYYDSTMFATSGLPANWNYGYIQNDKIFSAGITGVAGGAVLQDSFIVKYPVVRSKFVETVGTDASGTFIVAWYMNTPDNIRSAPAGIRRERLFDDRMKQLIKETKLNK
jgi:hypothetical protein